jgi:RNA polymerase sigma-70 factor (ECF subfamily)
VNRQVGVPIPRLRGPSDVTDSYRSSLSAAHSTQVTSHPGRSLRPARAAAATRGGARPAAARSPAVVIGAEFDAVLAAAKEGQEEAFATLWRDLNPALLRYLRVVAPGAAEDLASEIWLEIVRALGRFSGSEEGLRSWVFTIARHRAVDRRRRAARQPVQPLPVETLTERPGPDDAAAAALDRLSTDRALALIAELPRDQAEVVLLRVIAGLDVARVASIVGKRPGTVRVLGHRGLRRLATRLGQGLLLWDVAP